jgi:hypothetical protein
MHGPYLPPAVESCCLFSSIQTYPATSTCNIQNVANVPTTATEDCREDGVLLVIFCGLNFRLTARRTNTAKRRVLLIPDLSINDQRATLSFGVHLLRRSFDLSDLRAEVPSIRDLSIKRIPISVFHLPYGN